MWKWLANKQAARGETLVFLMIGGLSAYLNWKIGVPILVALGFIGLWLILHSNSVIQATNTLNEGYTFEQLNKGVDVYVPPAAAKEILFKLKKGETTKIEINSVEPPKDDEHHIDSMVLDRHRKMVIGWDRSIYQGYGLSIPMHKTPKPKGQPKIHEGQYILRLSNEYQTMFEKKIHVRVSQQPYLGNGTITLAIGTMRWS